MTPATEDSRYAWLSLSDTRALVERTCLRLVDDLGVTAAAEAARNIVQALACGDVDADTFLGVVGMLRVRARGTTGHAARDLDDAQLGYLAAWILREYVELADPPCGRDVTRKHAALLELGVPADITSRVAPSWRGVSS